MEDRETVYMAGNGQIVCAYHEGDIVNFFGPPYSSPSVFESRFTLSEGTEKSVPYHMPKAGIWKIDFSREGKIFAEVTDFALAYEPCLVRRIESSGPVSLEIGAWAGRTDFFQYEIPADENRPEEGFLLKTRGGNYVYNDYPLPYPQFYRLSVRGEGSIEHIAPYRYRITVDGKADILIIGGPSYPECDEAAKRIVPMPYSYMLEETLGFWEEEFSCVDIESRTPADFPERERFLKAIDDTVINLIVQQSDAGGVLAGSPFPLGYVRDQYGVCMCMLSLGLAHRARKMLGFYIDTFRHSGKVLNAQALGVPGLFHFAENDATEITGYLLLQFFRYADETGDWDLLRDNADFLVWLYKRQESQIHNNMLPFNGDETYIAGGLLPRDVLDEGSAEATMLFIMSGRRLLSFLEDEELNLINMRATELILKAVEDDYRRNFVIDGKYTLNNPERLKGLSEPDYRYGVCMNLGRVEGCEFFGWTKLCASGVYVCPNCLSRGKVPEKINKAFYLPSALLMPAYLDSPLPGDDVIIDTLRDFAGKMSRDGFLYSDEAARKNIGYDYGLLLVNYLRYGFPGAGQVYRKILDLADGVGTWSERYIEDRPDGCRYRPWESAINVYAMIQYMKEYSDVQH